MTKKRERPAGNAGLSNRLAATDGYSAHFTRQYVTNQAGRPVGEIVHGVLQKHANAAAHMLRSPRGWAWDATVLEQARAAGCTVTEIIDDEAGLIYRAPVALFGSAGLPIARGHGLQFVLPLRHWSIRPIGAPHVEQLELFAGGG